MTRIHLDLRSQFFIYKCRYLHTYLFIIQIEKGSFFAIRAQKMSIIVLSPLPKTAVMLFYILEICLGGIISPNFPFQKNPLNSNWTLNTFRENVKFVFCKTWHVMKSGSLHRKKNIWKCRLNKSMKCQKTFILINHEKCPHAQLFKCINYDALHTHLASDLHFALVPQPR